MQSHIIKVLTWGCSYKDARLLDTTRPIQLSPAALVASRQDLKTKFAHNKSNLQFVHETSHIKYTAGLNAHTETHTPAARLACMLWKQQLGLMLKLALWRCVFCQTDRLHGRGEWIIAGNVHTASRLTRGDTPALSWGSREGGRSCRSERAVQTQMSMRRFFRAHRDEDYGQIQYLTAKCTRLAHDKGKPGRRSFDLWEWS